MARTAEELPVAARADAVRYSIELGDAMAAAFRHGVEVGRLVGAGMPHEAALTTPAMVTARAEVLAIAHPVVGYLDDYAVLRARCPGRMSGGD